MQLVFVALLCMAASANSFAFGHEEEQDVTTGGIKCSREGPMCKDCKQLVQCIKGKTDFEARPLATCTDLAPCDDTKKGCVYGGICRYKEFKCPMPVSGKVPDPYSCRQYHRCHEGKGIITTCLFPKAFNPSTNKCDLTLDNPLCKEGPIKVCERNGEKIIMEGTSYEYECLKEFDNYEVLYPHMNANPGSTSTTKPIITTTQAPLINCYREGYFSHPTECTAYVECYRLPNGQFGHVVKYCRTGARFDAVKQVCVRGTCTNAEG